MKTVYKSLKVVPEIHALIKGLSVSELTTVSGLLKTMYIDYINKQKEGAKDNGL